MCRRRGNHRQGRTSVGDTLSAANAPSACTFGPLLSDEMSAMLSGHEMILPLSTAKPEEGPSILSELGEERSSQRPAKPHAATHESAQAPPPTAPSTPAYVM